MYKLPADAVVEIVFGVINVILTVAIFWQTRSIRSERHRRLRAFSPEVSLLNTLADVETGDDVSLGHAPIVFPVSFISLTRTCRQRPTTLRYVKAYPEEKLLRRTTF